MGVVQDGVVAREAIELTQHELFQPAVLAFAILVRFSNEKVVQLGLSDDSVGVFGSHIGSNLRTNLLQTSVNTHVRQV